MLVFITSIRHPKNSNSFSKVEQLLFHTLNSVQAQTSDRFQVIIVCNRNSLGSMPNGVVKVEVDFPPPSTLSQPETGMHAIQMDRGLKYAAGVLNSAELRPTHYMFFDADDLVSRNLVELTCSQPDCPGWFFESGYTLRYGASKLSLINDFHKYCGTSHIVRSDLITLPAGISPDSDYDTLSEKLNRSYVKSFLGSHRLLRKLYAVKGFTLQALPFAGAIWVMGHGENHSGKDGIEGDIYPGNEIIDEFLIPDHYMRSNPENSNT